MPIAIPEQIGRYAVFEKVAAGGMASVHVGRLHGVAGFSRTVAIKRLHRHLAEDPEFRSTLIDEARLAARIQHPNVVPMLDVVAADGELLLVMEYVRGESLARLLRAQSDRGERAPVRIVSAIVAGALQGLHAAHEATSDRGTPLGIVHRDVSPQNILVGLDGTPRIIDFGVAKAAGRLQTTREGTFKGKLAYSAPEQLSSGPVTPRVDVYAMAVVLWEALTGKRLFRADDEAAVIARVLLGATEPPSRYASPIAPELDALVMRGLAVDPERRFASAREMAEALMGIVAPAFSSDVGAWVAEHAREALSEMNVTLAAIERGSGFVDVKAPPAPSSTRDEVVTVTASAADGGARDPAKGSSAVIESPSSLSVDTPPVERARGARTHLASVAAIVLGMLAVIALVALWRAPATTRQAALADRLPPKVEDAASSVAPSATSSASTAPSPAAATAPESTVAPATAPESTAAPATAPESTSLAPPPRAPRSGRPQPTRAPPGPLRFTHPD